VDVGVIFGCSDYISGVNKSGKGLLSGGHDVCNNGDVCRIKTVGELGKEAFDSGKSMGFIDSPQATAWVAGRGCF